MNPVLGPCGERFPVSLYFPAVIAANLLLGHYLGDWRSQWFAGMTGVEGSTIYSNWMRD